MFAFALWLTSEPHILKGQVHSIEKGTFFLRDGEAITSQLHLTCLKEMATHSSILAWSIPWTEELGGLQSTGLKESDTTEQLHFHFHFEALRESEQKRKI